MTTRHAQRQTRTGRSLRVVHGITNETACHAATPAQLPSANRTRSLMARALRPMSLPYRHRLQRAGDRIRRQPRSPAVEHTLQLGDAMMRAERLHRDVRGATAYARRLLRSPRRQVRDLGRELLDHARQLAATVARHILRPLRRALAQREPIDSPTRASRAPAPPPPTDPLIRAHQLVAAPGAPGTERGRFARAA